MNTKKTENRTVLVAFRLTEIEFKQLNDVAKVKGLNRSDYIRKALKLDAEAVTE